MSDKEKKAEVESVEKKDEETSEKEQNSVATIKALESQVRVLISELDGLKTENAGLKAKIAEQNSLINSYVQLERNSVVDRIKAIDPKFEDTDSLDKRGLEIVLNSLERTASNLASVKSETKKEIPKTEFIHEQNSVIPKTSYDVLKSVIGGK